MTEKIRIKDQDVWITVDPVAVHRNNHQTIPTEYFMATYFLQEPEATEAAAGGHRFEEEAGKPRLFLSPVEALEFAREVLEEVL